MDTRKIFLYAALCIVGLMLWSAWQNDYGHKPNQTPVANSSTTSQVSLVNNIAPNTTIPKEIAKDRLIHVKTDVLDVSIDTLGGSIVNTSLIKYPQEKGKTVPIQILTPQEDGFYVAESDLTGLNNNQPIAYKATNSNFVLSPNDKTLTLSLTGVSGGISVVKTFIFNASSYAINIDYQINNKSNKSWSGQVYNQIKRKQPAEVKGFFALRTYDGAAVYTPEKPYQKLTYSKLNSENLSKDIQGGWVAMQQRYFLSAWIPDQNQTHHYYSSVADKIFTIGMTTPITIASGEQSKISSKLYVGPEINNNLEPLAKGLNLTIDYGWLWFISVAIFWVMQQIFNVIGNWGWAIVIVTIVIKGLFYKLSEASYKSSAKMRLLAPKIQALKERYGSDRQKITQATMELYRQEKVNPLGGCLPMLIQIPVFIGLYYVLIEAVQLRQTPFIFWIQDLSTKDPYFILPVLMGISMYLTTKLNPPSPDPTQQKMMLFMPVIFTVLFASFPSGLVLYWLVNNVLSVLQQWHIIRRYEREHAQKRKSQR